MKRIQSITIVGAITYTYKIGTCINGEDIFSIEEIGSLNDYGFFNRQGEKILKISNCPVIVKYTK